MRQDDSSSLALGTCRRGLAEDGGSRDSGTMPRSLPVSSPLPHSSFAAHLLPRAPRSVRPPGPERRGPGARRGSRPGAPR